MTTEALRAASVQYDVTLREAVEVIDAAALATCCLVDRAGRLVAVLTDGDVRRAVLNGVALESPALDQASRSPRIVLKGTPRAHVLDLMHALRISAIPEVDEGGVLVGLHTLSGITGGQPLANSAVVMAGGKGTRLGVLTRATPKPLMTVAGRPIIEWIVLGLVSDGIQRVFVSVNHLADQIIDRLGDGSRLGCAIEYLRETEDNPLGTGGSLTLLPSDITLPSAPPIVVMNGDLMVDYNVRELLRVHDEASASITMGTQTYTHAVPFGVVDVDHASRVTALREKPVLSVEINTAVYCVEAELVHLLPFNEPSTMPELAQRCLDSGRPVVAWPISSEWIDIGTPADLARAKGHA